MIIKRNGKKVDFDVERVELAVGKAMLETDVGLVSEEIEQVVSDVQFAYSEAGELTVEEVQDLIEQSLVEHGRFDVARRYIVYREERSKKRDKSGKGVLLSEDFLSKYKHKTSPKDLLGQFVYYRTYSRFLPEEGRREYWWETVRRAVEYNCSLIQTSKEEAEELYDNIFYLRQFLSGEQTPLVLAMKRSKLL